MTFISFYNTTSSYLIYRLNLLLNVLDLCVACFEYKGKRNLTSQVSGIAAMSSKSTDVKNRLTDALVSGIGTAKERHQSIYPLVQPSFGPLTPSILVQPSIHLSVYSTSICQSKCTLFIINPYAIPYVYTD